MPQLKIFGLEFKKNFGHIWTQPTQICLISTFYRKIKMPKLGTKNALFGHFWSNNFKSSCHIWNHHPLICLTAKFQSEKKAQFWEQNYLIFVFWGCNLKITLSYFKSVPLNLSYCKILQKKIMPNFGTQNTLFGYFLLEF